MSEATLVCTNMSVCMNQNRFCGHDYPLSQDTSYSRGSQTRSWGPSWGHVLVFALAQHSWFKSSTLDNELVIWISCVVLGNKPKHAPGRPGSSLGTPVLEYKTLQVPLLSLLRGSNKSTPAQRANIIFSQCPPPTTDLSKSRHEEKTQADPIRTRESLVSCGLG